VIRWSSSGGGRVNCWNETEGHPTRRVVSLAGCGLLLWLATVVPRLPAAEPATARPADALEQREAELLRQYRDLERSFLRLADLLAPSDPRRAALLRDAFQQAREAELGDRLDRIVTLLEAGHFLAAGTTQESAVEQLRALLDLLEEGGRGRTLTDTKADVRRFLSRVTKLIARQRDIEGSSEAGSADEPLAARQREAAAEAVQLAEDVESFIRRVDDSTRSQEGRPRTEDSAQPTRAAPAADTPPAGARQPTDQEPGGDDNLSRAQRTRQRVQAAERRMREAEARLAEAQRQTARAEQERAIEELESARAELEEILRQMREEEVGRLLVQLETRVRAMLKAELHIRDAADKAAAAAALSRRERQLEAGRLGREQQGVTADVDRALLLVRDDGSAVAVLEALGQVRDDSAHAAAALARGDLGSTTTSLVRDIVTGLEEMLAALEKSRGEPERDEQQPQGSGGRAAEPDEQPLVDRLAELKMLRSLQARVNARTERFATLLDDAAEQADQVELIAALGRLADRQRVIERAARDIVTGRPER